MKKTIFLSLLITFSSVAAISDVVKYGSSGHYSGDYNGNKFKYTANAKISKDFEALNHYACENVIARTNRILFQLVLDIEKHANLWVIYSDLDGIDEMSYYLARTCETENLDIVSSTKNNGSPNKACEMLGDMVLSVLEQDTVNAFRGGYKNGISFSDKASQLSKHLGRDCKISLVQKKNTQDQSGTPEIKHSTDEGKSSSSNQQVNMVQVINWDSISAEEESLSFNFNGLSSIFLFEDYDLISEYLFDIGEYDDSDRVEYISFREGEDLDFGEVGLQNFFGELYSFYEDYLIGNEENELDELSAIAVIEKGEDGEDQYAILFDLNNEDSTDIGIITSVQSFEDVNRNSDYNLGELDEENQRDLLGFLSNFYTTNERKNDQKNEKSFVERLLEDSRFTLIAE